MKKSKEQKYDEFNAERMDLIHKKYARAGRLTAAEEKKLERLHSKIQKLAPQITPHILQRMAEIKSALKSPTIRLCLPAEEVSANGE